MRRITIRCRARLSNGLCRRGSFASMSRHSLLSCQIFGSLIGLRGHAHTCDSIGQAGIVDDSRTWFKPHQGLYVSLDLSLLAFELCPRLLTLEDLLTLHSVTTCHSIEVLGWVERIDTTEKIGFLCTMLSQDLAAQIAQIITKFRILDCHLLVKSLFLSKAPLEHVDLFSELVVFKLILVSFSPDVLIALLPQFFKLSMLGLLQRFDHVICLI